MSKKKVVSTTIDKDRQKICYKVMDYISDHIETDKSKQTHMWFGKDFDKKMFRIEDDEYEDFLKLVKTTANEILKHNDMEALHVLELPPAESIFNLDLDIKFVRKNTYANYIEPINIIEILQKNISKYFVLSEDKCELHAFFMAKPNPFFDYEKNIYSDGIHITFPNLILDTVDKNFILDLLIDEIRRTNEFDELINVLLVEQFEKNKNKKIAYNEDLNSFMDNEGNIIDIGVEKEKIINSIFDRCVFNKTKWFMYGSGKENYTNKDIYKVKYIYDEECNLIDKVPTVTELIEMFAIRKPIRKRTMPNNKKRPNHKTMKKEIVNNTLELVKSSKEPIDVKNASKNTNDNNSAKTIEQAKKYTMMLKNDDIHYDDWKNVGICLHNISDTLLDTFVTFSQKSSKFNLEECNKFWKTYKKNDNAKQLTIASLRYWAKTDNPDEYAKFYNDSICGLTIENSNKIKNVFKNINMERDHEIALLLKTIYGRRFRSSCIKTKTWYHFENHRWAMCDVGYKLNNLISEDFTKYIHEMYRQYTEDHLNNINDDEAKKKKDKCYAFITKLNKSSYKKSLMDECSNTFYEKDFNYRLDENKHLIGFENGVFDISTNEFRDGLPEDMLTFSTGYNYNMDYSLEHEDVKEVEKIIKMILPNDDVRQFCLCNIASSVEGGNKDQKMVFWIGPGGRNGKSTLQNLISNAFGRYYKYIENSLITKERGKSNEATPDIMELKGVRNVILSELEPGTKIHAGFFKRITGGDPLKGRALYANEIIEFIPQFTPILISNNIPEFTSINDNAVWRRVCVVDFTQKFVDNPTKSNEHKIDNNLPQKLEKFNGAFMWLLLNKYYPIYKKYGLDNLTPESVKEATNRAKVETEPYLKFKEENIEDDEKSFIDVDSLKQIYKGWHEGFYNKKATKPAGIIDYFVGEGYKKKGKTIYGIKHNGELGMINEIDNPQFGNK